MNIFVQKRLTWFWEENFNYNQQSIYTYGVESQVKIQEVIKNAWWLYHIIYYIM